MALHSRIRSGLFPLIPHSGILAALRGKRDVSAVPERKDDPPSTLRGRRAVSAVILFLAAVFAAVLPAVSAPTQKSTSLKLLFTHDLHSSVLPQAATADDGSVRPRGGYARLFTAIQAERDRDTSVTVLVDAGDFSMGTLFHTLFMREAVELRLMGIMGYDAGTFGNHDFDFGLDGLARTLDAARTSGDPTLPLVISNLTLPPGHPRTDRLRAGFDTYGVGTYKVITRGGLRIGVFGLMGEDAAGHCLFMGPASFGRIIPAARAVVTTLREKEQVDLIICLSHVGTHADHSDSEDEELALEVPGIDVIVSGHTHTTLSQPLHIGTAIIVSGGAYCSNLGVLEMDVAGRGAVSVKGYRLVPVDAAIPEDTLIAGRVEQFRRIIDSTYLRPLGFSFGQEIAVTGHTFESVAYGYRHPGELGLGNLITDAFRHAVRNAEGSRYVPIDVVIEPLGMIRSSFDTGPVTVGEVFSVLSLGRGPDGTPGYPLIAPYVTGEDLLLLLEIDPTLATWKFDAHLQYSGVQYAFNPYRLPLNRVTRAELVDPRGGLRPIELDSLYRICVNLYTGFMMSSMEDLSWGLLHVQPRRADGTPIAHFSELIVDADTLRPGIQELKEWVALAGYMRSFPPGSAGGLPLVPATYRGPAGRFGPEPSVNPADLLGSPNRFAMRAVGGLIAFCGALLLFALSYRIRFRKAR